MTNIEWFEPYKDFTLAIGLQNAETYGRRLREYGIAQETSRDMLATLNGTHWGRNFLVDFTPAYLTEDPHKAYNGQRVHYPFRFPDTSELDRTPINMDSRVDNAQKLGLSGSMIMKMMEDLLKVKMTATGFGFLNCFVGVAGSELIDTQKGRVSPYCLAVRTPQGIDYSKGMTLYIEDENNVIDRYELWRPTENPHIAEQRLLCVPIDLSSLKELGFMLLRGNNKTLVEKESQRLSGPIIL